MSYRWTRDQIEKLIICIEENPCIYNIKCMEYLDKRAKTEAFHKILEEMQTLESSITLEEIKRKWKNLRTQYAQEVRMMKQAKESGADDCSPKLWCFQQLDFLKDNSYAPTPGRQKQKRSFSPNEESVREDPLAEKIQKMIPRVPNMGPVTSFRNDLENFKNILCKKNSEKKFAWLGYLVANQMDEICAEDQADAAWQVQCLMRRLTQESLLKKNSSRNKSLSTNIIELSAEGINNEYEHNEYN